VSVPGVAVPVPPGASADIARRQDEPEHLQRLLAYSHVYRVAQRWRRARAVGTLGLAAVAPLVSLMFPATTEVLAAIAAGWLVLGRTALSALEQHTRDRAATMQELYDTRLFYLPWNGALAGRAPIPDDIARAARHIDDNSRYQQWYSVDLSGIPWPADVLLCQRQSMVWSRGDHRAYANTLLVAGIAWFVFGVVIGLIGDLTLSDYLIKLFLPTSPALLDAAELSREHRRHAQAREQVLHDLDDLYEVHRQDLAATPVAACRRIQDAAFLLRRSSPRVPNFFYRFRHTGSTADTAAGVAALLRDGPQP
jgi:SMODS-associating 4TM effector domain